MKRFVVAAAVAVCFAFITARPAVAAHNCRYGTNQRCKVSGNKVPMSPAAFKALRAKLPKDLFHAAALYVYALIAFAKNPAVGEKLMLLASHPKLLSKGAHKSVYKGWGWARGLQWHIKRIKRSPRVSACFPGYASNATEGNGRYSVDMNNAEVEIRTQKRYVSNPANGRAKVWVCPINRMCFPLNLARTQVVEGGRTMSAWKISGMSSAFTGCRAAKRPAKVNPEL